jgi:hypothetical protein
MWSSRLNIFLVVTVALLPGRLDQPAALAQSHRLPVRPTKVPVLWDQMQGPRPALAVTPRANQRVAEHAVVTLQATLADSQPAAATAQTISAERLVIRLPSGESAQAIYRVPPSPVISELEFRCRVWCNHPGMRLAAAVELPRSIDVETGKPRRLIVRGEQRGGAGRWQTLSLAGLPVTLQRHVRTARVKYDRGIDARGAVVVGLVLLLPGGTQATELLLDDVAMYGVFAAPETRPTGETNPISLAAAEAPITAARAAHPSNRVEPPKMPRIIQWQGEDFEWLRDLGFQAILMAEFPTNEQLQSASRVGLSVVCPPPPPGTPAEDFTTRFDAVLAWDLGVIEVPDDVATIDRLRRQLRQVDPSGVRPVVLRPGPLPREASCVSDVLLVERLSSAGGSTASSLARGIHDQLRLARPGTSRWMGVGTHITLRQQSQLAALRGGGTVPEAHSYETLTSSLSAAIAGRPSGILFHSDARLDGRDTATQQRRIALQLANFRLGLLEPWLTAAKPTTTARCSHPDLTSLVLQAERSQLVVPVRWQGSAVGSEMVPPGPVSFVLPGTAESAEAYLLTATTAQPLSTRRVAGGLRVSVAQLPHEAVLLVTEDGVAYAHVDRYLRRHAQQAAQLRIDLAALNLRNANTSWHLLPAEAVQDLQAMPRVAHDQMLKEAQEAWRVGRFADAYRWAADLDLRLAYLLQQVAAQLGVSDLPIDLPRHRPPESDRDAGPFAVPTTWSTISDVALATIALRHRETPWQPVAGGGFEDLSQLLAAGWQRAEFPYPQLNSAVRLSPVTPFAGTYALELESRPRERDVVPGLLAPPVWIASPEIRVEAGQLLEIRGRSRNGSPELGPVSTLAVFETLGGEESAVCAGNTPTWRPFRLVRAVRETTTTRITLALRHLGRAQVDQLEYRLLPLAPLPHGVRPEQLPTTGTPAELTAQGRSPLGAAAR